MTETILTIDEIAEKLKMSHSTVRREIKRGRLRALRSGKLIRVRQSSLDEYLLGAEEDYMEQLRDPLSKPESGARQRTEKHKRIGR